MWDIGTAALIYRTKIAYINKPLAIVSENSPNRESLSNRTRWGKEPISLVPLYVPSIDSCFVETILKVIETNKLLSNNEYIHIHPEYYFNLLNTIMQDNPITETTRHDFIKVNLKIFTLSIFSPNIIIKLYLANFKKIRKFIKRFIKKATLYNRITDTNKNFYTITEYREFIENYFEN